MSIKNIAGNFLIILVNYKRLVRNIIFFLIYTALIAGISLVITVPLWYAATEHSKGYTITVILLLVTLTGMLLVRNLKEWISARKKSGLNRTEIILIPLKKIAVFTFFVLCLYGIIFLFSRGLLLIASSLTAGYLLMLGYFIFIYRKNSANNHI